MKFNLLPTQPAHAYSTFKIDEWDVSKWVFHPVSGHNATDKMPMHEMPLTFVLGGWAFFVLGFRVLAFCHWRLVPGSFHFVGLFNAGL